MTGKNHFEMQLPQGISLGGTPKDVSRFMDFLAALNLPTQVQVHKDSANGTTFFHLSEDAVRWLAPDFDTTTLPTLLALDPISSDEDQTREILVSMLLSPLRFNHPSFDALASMIQVRKNIINAASKTELAFDTSDAAERPCHYWTYSEEHGFTVIPGKPLIDALRKATQPESSGKHYDFSCYRATEYVILLGIAEELKVHNPKLLSRLQRQWEINAIKSCAFHETFLTEHGSMESPLPPRFYVPGDRVWFRNPDEHSSDVEGYEGSWVIYLGGGLFTNFWKHHQPYTLRSKCLEIYHWRFGTYTDSLGNLQIDESIVEEKIHACMSNLDEAESIVQRMMRFREPGGVYVDGGCIDTSREYPRSICLKSGEFCLPDA